MRTLVLCVAIAALPLSAAVCRCLHSNHCNNSDDSKVSPVTMPASEQTKSPPQAIAVQKAQAIEAFAGIPRMFLENQGNLGSGVRYLTKGSGLTTHVLDDGLFVRLKGQLFSSDRPTNDSGSSAVANIRVTFEGANSATRFDGVSPVSSRINFLTGADPSAWRPETPAFGEVTCHDIYPGVDLHFHDQDRQLEYDLVLTPGATLEQIVARYDGIEGLDLAEDGSLVAFSRIGTLRQSPPVTYELAASGARRPVECRFRILGKDRFGFEAGTRDSELTLVIDPGVMLFATYMGGFHTDKCFGVAVDTQNGYSFVTGETQSGNYPATVGSWDSLFDLGGGGINSPNDAFISKVGPIGRTLVFSTFVGGTGGERGNGIALKPSGESYITGFTTSSIGQTPPPTSNFYVTPGLTFGTIGGLGDAFLLKLNPAGNGVIYSTVALGDQYDEAMAIALDTNGDPYICGDTNSNVLPVWTPFQGGPLGSGDAFVGKFAESPTGATVGQAYFTFLGSPLTDDHANGIVVDASGRAFVVGKTAAGFPTTTFAFQPQWQGLYDAFITAFAPNGSPSPGTPLSYSTYLGGASNDWANGIAMDPSGNIYVVGETNSVSGGATGFPVTVGAHSTTLNTPPPYLPSPPPPITWVPSDAFLASFTTTVVVTVRFCTYYGGYLDDAGYGVAADGQHVYITGCTQSYNSIAYQVGSIPPFSSSIQGNQDAFVARFSNAGAMTGATYLGGTGPAGLTGPAQAYYGEIGRSIAIDGSGSSYTAGWCGTGIQSFVPQQTYDFVPLSFNWCLQSVYGGYDFDGFLVKFAP